MSKALYRKYRSRSLDEVVGQDHITTILSRAIKKGKVAHAYLFTGPRGVGKTSVARILAHEINKLPYDEQTQHPDIIEIDAASNRRIDDIRDLRDKVQIAPASAQYKVYIIDEVHMLTGESFNAFLKTLEEPPRHVVFILATTDAHKLPVTITSRTQRFSFRAIAPEAAIAHLRFIASQEKITVDDEALELIAVHGDGSFRDSISLLDQVSGLASKDQPISRSLIENVLGMAPNDQIETLIKAYEAEDRQAIIVQLEQFAGQGVAASVVTEQLLRAVRRAIAEKPQFVTLLDRLVTVSTSPRPDIKLLVALLPAIPAHKTVAATATSIPGLQPLEKEATKPRPSEKRARSEVANKPEKTTDTAATPKEEIVEKDHKPSGSTKAMSPKKLVNFDWNGYVAQVRKNNVALASILAKCKAESDGVTLMIYAGTAFWKKKLDDVRYQPILHDELGNFGMGDISIETVATTMPPRDSKAAAVAAIMGGGEEVEL